MTKIFFILFTFINIAYSYEPKVNGGGTVVGNGAGIVESNFQYAYQTLRKIVPNCMQFRTCDLTLEETKIVIKINDITHMNSNKKDRLIFLSEKGNPGFFTTGVSEQHRIAKTFLNPLAPIYINTDLLYDDKGIPALTFKDILRVLIHELGHQAGVEEHTSLDILGAKIATFSEEHTSYYRYKISNEQNVTFTVTNIESPVKTAVVMFNWINQESIDLSDIIIRGSVCLNSSESFAGQEVVNGHFALNSNGNIIFQAWINVSCYESFSGQVFVYKRDLNINLDENYKIFSLFIK